MQHSYHRCEKLHHPPLGAATATLASPPVLGRADLGPDLDAVLTAFRAGTALAPRHGAAVDSAGRLAAFHWRPLLDREGANHPETR